MAIYRITAVMKNGHTIDKKLNLSDNCEMAECELECHLPGIKEIIMFARADAPCWNLISNGYGKV